MLYFPTMLSNADKLLVFCLRKNTKLQNETSISATFGR